MEEAFSVTSDILTTDNNNLPLSSMSNNKDPVWLIILQRSQLIMTIIGVIANLGTSITLIKNGQVSVTSYHTVKLNVGN